MRRNKKAHKNQFGHVLVLAGSPSMLGAAALTGLAAMRSGAGLTTIGVAKGLNLTLQKKISNVIMTLPLMETKTGCLSLAAHSFLKKNWSKYSAVAIGPGLGQEAPTRKLVLKLVADCPLPMVVDADALNALAQGRKALKKYAALRILTPHPGEFFRLTGTKPVTDAERKREALAFALEYGCILVLKGHRTVVASPDGRVCVNTTGNPGMATAGSGDVLTGMVAALLAQGIAPFEAARIAVFLHGKAGDEAAGRYPKVGMVASDILERIGRSI